MKLKIFIFLITFLLISSFFISACSKIKVDSDSNRESINPGLVVKTYYESLDRKDYETMYYLISDGFKKIEPTANDFQTFKNYMGNFFDVATGVEVVNVKETSNNGKESTVDYTINILSQSGKKEFKSTFTLKKRETGWKLIHPYGDNID